MPDSTTVGQELSKPEHVFCATLGHGNWSKWRSLKSRRVQRHAPSGNGKIYAIWWYLRLKYHVVEQTKMWLHVVHQCHKTSLVIAEVSLAPSAPCGIRHIDFADWVGYSFLSDFEQDPLTFPLVFQVIFAKGIASVHDWSHFSIYNFTMLEIRFTLKLTLLADLAVFTYSPFDNRYKPFENTSLTLFGWIFFIRTYFKISEIWLPNLGKSWIFGQFPCLQVHFLCLRLRVHL